MSATPYHEEFIAPRPGPAYGHVWRLSSSGAGTGPAGPPDACPGCGGRPLVLVDPGYDRGPDHVLHPWGCPVAVRLSAEYLAATAGAGDGDWRAAALTLALEAGVATAFNPDGHAGPAARHWQAVAVEPEPPPFPLPVLLLPDPEGRGVIEGTPDPTVNHPGYEALLERLRAPGSPFRPGDDAGHLLYGATVARPVSFKPPAEPPPASDPADHVTDYDPDNDPDNDPSEYEP